MAARLGVVRAAAVLAAAVLSLTACPGPEPGPEPQRRAVPTVPTPTTPGTSTPFTVPFSVPTTLGLPAPLPPTEKVRRDVEGLVPLLNEFWSRQLPGWRPPAAVREYDHGNELVCGRSYLAADNAWYCPADHSVAYDISWFSSYVARHPGGATTFLIMAHEFGHAAQELWVRSGGGDSWNPPYRKELGADCLAGAFLISAIRDGSIVEEEGDVEAIFGWLYETGAASSPWLDPGSHGTKDQRQQAFVDGLQQGVTYCRQAY